MITKYMLLILKLYIEYMVHSFWQLNYPFIYLSSVYEMESLSLPLPSPYHTVFYRTLFELNAWSRPKTKDQQIIKNFSGALIVLVWHLTRNFQLILWDF